MAFLWRAVHTTVKALHQDRPILHVPHVLAILAIEYKTRLLSVLCSYSCLMPDHPKVAIFWDYENCSPPSNSCGLGFGIVNNISRIARLFGSVTMFRAYLDISTQSSKSILLRSELQSSGVTMIDCPHNGKKDVVDKMMLVDMLAFAVDHPAPATIILITGDRDYAYAASILKLRKYQVILVVPSAPHTSPCLESQASLVIDWSTAILRSRTEPSNSTQPVRQPYFDLDPAIITRILKELQLEESSCDDSDATPYSLSTPSQGASRVRRITARDLLEPSSFDSIQDSIHDPFSLGKCTSTGSDTAPEVLPVPKTPSRSRHTSISTGCTRARNATVVTPSLPVEQYTPAKNPPSIAGESSTSDITDVSNRATRSLSVLTSLDALELSLHDDRPPSSIIVRSPLDPDQSTCDMPDVSEEPSPPCSHESDCLASPFVLAMTRTVLESVPSQQSHTTINPPSPTVPWRPTRMLAQTIATCETPQAKDIAAPIEPDNLTGLRFEKDKGITKKSIPHERLEDAAKLTNSNNQTCVASHTTHSPLNRSVGLQPVDVPASEHVAIPAAGFLGARDGVDPTRLPPFSWASNRDDVTPGSVSASSGATLSIPPAVTESHIVDSTDQCKTWAVFKPLIQLLLAARMDGIVRPARTVIAVDLVKADKYVYQRAGVSKFKQYTALAMKAGIIELGGGCADSWIALNSNWFGVDGITTTQFDSNSVSSPTFDSAKATQDPILTAPETPVIEAAEIPRSLTPRAFDVSPTHNQLDGASWYSQYQPLINALVRIRALGCDQPRRSLVGQMLNQEAYSRAGVSGFKDYILRAAEAQVIEFGGVGGFAWIQLHPELGF